MLGIRIFDGLHDLLVKCRDWKGIEGIQFNGIWLRRIGRDHRKESVAAESGGPSVERYFIGPWSQRLVFVASVVSTGYPNMANLRLGKIGPPSSIRRLKTARHLIQWITRKHKRRDMAINLAL